MKKILYILSTGNYSGAENVVIQIIKNLNNTMYSGIYASPDGEIRNVLKKENIEYYPVERISVRDVRNLINIVKPDIIHANDYNATCKAVLTNTKIPIISHLHNNPVWLKTVNPRTLIFNHCVKRCSNILLVSNVIYKDFVFRKTMDNRFFVIGNPIDIDAIRSGYKSQPSKEYDILVLGRLTKQKNPFKSLSIIKKVSEKQSIKAIFVGEGELRVKLERRITKHALGHTVKLLGYKSNPYEYIAKSKIILMPSRWEGFGLVAVEGLVYGVPVVTSGAGGLSDIINNKCGRICDTESDYIEEILMLLNDDQYYISKSKKAMNRAKELNNYRKYHKQLSEIYDKI